MTEADPLYRDTKQKIVLVTPEMAASWLENNTNNRLVNQAAVARYAKAMKEGRWLLSGEALKLDRDMNLMDGQHRCWACVMSDTPFETLVIWGLDPAVKNILDTGTVRSLKDVLTINGMSNGNNVGAAAKLLYRYDHGGLMNNLKIDNDLMLDYIQDNNPPLVDLVNSSSSISKHIGLQQSIVAAAYYMCWRVDMFAAHEFFALLSVGNCPDPRDPILALRARLKTISNSKTRVPAWALLSLVIRTWNHWRAGHQLDNIPLNRGQSPIPCPDPK